MDREVQKIKDEYEEKQRRKKERRKAKEKDKGKDKEKDKEDKKDEADEDKNDEKERDEKAGPPAPSPRARVANVQQIKSLSNQAETKADDGPRIFTLKKYVPVP